MSDRLDEVDKRILYNLVRDARNTSAPDIADEVNVSAGTIRNRITHLEAAGIIRGYHAVVSYPQVGGRLTNLYICTSPVPDRDRLSKQVAEIPGVVSVRQLMKGRSNLHVTAVGDDMQELTRIANDLSAIGLDIEEENLLQSEEIRPYHEFGPDDSQDGHTIADFMELSGGAEVVELSVAADAEIAGHTLREANERGVIESDVLVVSIERDDEMLTPRGDTRVRPDDLVTVFCRGGISQETLSVFGKRGSATET
ncbi:MULTISPECIES: Lrp/AsnC family transcriptional regulator [Halobacterium]|uniref:Transcription regulator n=4 Tax=Halobacterium salinarum TaxID=2242 RepID=Q9HQ80_HALSA|nr:MULTISPECIES: Lrp/AsnC family transcriptional regulator [Halobacterium]AAG19636.1 transcription regulator [Halobacterium salinarum NRC-1]MBB6090326.1 Trk K+ transport system NAD-binding subunit [Halobacterium salinarum]MCF2165145.1 winged helix-turn-helix transcriptional regulator [Halobacterium salinarum]MCF2168046.1 winged helix-turn-helix transcriptional regulator [Halobacterium salinarum]MCF2206162.1 winged helix-turn-helix transcriptional regulator [Halobacterium salinarum]